MRSSGRRIDMSVMIKRIIMSISGVVLCGLSVGMFKHAAFGVDPFQALMSGLDAVIPIRFGTLYVIVNVLLLSFPLLVDRRKIGLATFINLFLLGYVVEFSQSLCAQLFPALGLAGRAILLAAALVPLALASSLLHGGSGRIHLRCRGSGMERTAEPNRVPALPYSDGQRVRACGRRTMPAFRHEFSAALWLNRHRHSHHSLFHGTSDRVF